MNWVRGLFRFWVVLSLIWITFHIATADVLHDMGKLYETYGKLGDNGGYIVRVKVVEALENARIAGDLEAVGRIREILDSSDGDIRSAAGHNFDTYKKVSIEHGQVMFVPPVVLGLFLLGIIWIVKGFRRTSRSE